MGPSRRRRTKLAVGSVVVAASVVGLILWGLTLPGAASFYLTVGEARARDAAGSPPYRVNGKVVAGSIERDGLTTTFEMRDDTGRMTVATDEPLPDTFRNGSEVVVRGRFDGDAFAASEVLAKCPSKFKAKR